MLCYTVSETGMHFGVTAVSTITALLMEAVSTSETSVNFYKTTWHIIPEDSHLPSVEFSGFLNSLHCHRNLQSGTADKELKQECHQG
jgi:hypothetical protein